MGLGHGQWWWELLVLWLLLVFLQFPLAESATELELLHLAEILKALLCSLLPLRGRGGFGAFGCCW